MFTIKIVSKIYDIRDGFAKCRFQNKYITNDCAAWSRGVFHNVGCTRHSPNKFDSALVCTPFRKTPAVCAERKMDCGAPTREALYYILCRFFSFHDSPAPSRACALRKFFP